MVQKPLQKKKNIGCFKLVLIVIFTPIVLLAGFIFFSTSASRRSDEDILKSYQPSQEIVEIVEKNMLTDHGKATLYRAEPELVDGVSYIKYCQTIARGVESLACNAPKPGGGPFGGRKIFLLNITDLKFADHKFSAAVHEMLHVAYARLGSSEKKKLNVLLDQELSKYQDDLHLITVVDTIRKRKGNATSDVQNELHSLFGVEYGKLSPELEEYYKQYFTNRQRVVKLFQSGGFDSRVRRMDELAHEGQVLNSKLLAMRDQLTAYQNAGDTVNYNNLVGQFNSMVSQYNADVAESHRIYNEIQEFYNYFKPDYQPLQQKKQ